LAIFCSFGWLAFDYDAPFGTTVWLNDGMAPGLMKQLCSHLELLRV